jgi:hypothetical protein
MVSSLAAKNLVHRRYLVRIHIFNLLFPEGDQFINLLLLARARNADQPLDSSLPAKTLLPFKPSFIAQLLC